MNPHRLRAYTYLLAVAGIWGAAGPIIKFTLKGIDPLPFLAYRFSLASIFSLIFFLAKIRRGKKFKRLKANFPLAIFYGILAVPLALGILFAALDRSSVLDLALIGVVGPMIVTLGASAFFHDHITRQEKIGIAIVLSGVILNSLFPLLKSPSNVRITGNLLLLVYLLADSSSVLVAKKAVRKKIKPSNLTNLAFIIGGLTLVPLALATYGSEGLKNIIINLPLEYHLGVWYMAFASGNLAYFLYVKGQATIEASEAVLFNYLQPLFMVPLAIFWLGEKLSTSFILGAVVIAIGLIIAETKKRRYNMQRKL